MRKQLQLQNSEMRSRFLICFSQWVGSGSDLGRARTGFSEDHADSWRSFRTVSRRCVCVCFCRGYNVAGVAVAQQGLVGGWDLVRPPLPLRPRVLVMLFLCVEWDSATTQDQSHRSCGVPGFSTNTGYGPSMRGYLHRCRRFESRGLPQGFEAGLEIAGWQFRVDRGMVSGRCGARGSVEWDSATPQDQSHRSCGVVGFSTFTLWFCRS